MRSRRWSRSARPAATSCRWPGCPSRCARRRRCTPTTRYIFEPDFELTALLFDRALAERLARAFEADLAESRAMDAGAIANQKLFWRLGEAGARLLSPLL